MIRAENMKRLKVFLLVLSLAIMFSCIGPFYEADLGKNVKLPVGTPFEVRLEGDPDSEYSWKLHDLDTNVVRMVLNPAYRPHNEDNRPGGIYSFYFQTVGEGETQIELLYASQNNPGLEANPRKKFHIGVQSGI
jgi:predicted secreted protein